ncbi:MAG: glycine cleavage system aminomethyltransferase T [Gammaproteobacteria bacterium]
MTYPGRQLNTARHLRSLPLEDEYRKSGAHFGQFYGWERPLYFNKQEEPVLTFGQPDWFENVKAEVIAAHTKAALFDASPFGKIEVEGSDAQAFMQHTCASNMSRAPGSAIYTAVLNERGTYESDITAHRISFNHYRLFVGTNAIKRDLAWFRLQSTNFNVSVKDSTENYAVLGLMGPDAPRIVAETGAAELNELGYFKLGSAHLAGHPIRAVRMSYVGEAGWEITMKTEYAKAIYQAFLSAGAVPAGLYAQTSMRVEKGFAAMGHELDSDITPVESGLDGMVSRKKKFIGSAALAERRGKATRSLVTVIVEDETAVPIGHEPIYYGDRIVGHTTSAAFGYRIGKPIALAHVHIDNPDGMNVELDITGVRFKARMQYAPAFDPAGSRMKTEN